MRPDPTSGPEEIFIYGTLIPGGERWPHLEEFVLASEPDTTRGKLYDTGLGYPAARFDATGTIADRIHGERMLLDPGRVDECLALLDEIESAVTGLYHRVVVETDQGHLVWSYQYGSGARDLIHIASGSWLQHTTGVTPEAANGEGGLLDPVEARVIGSLIEKELATPQNYPLSLNALVSACNQTSSRDPVMRLDPETVLATVTTGKERRLVRFVHPRSGHGVTKYRHVLDELLGLDQPATALIGVLLLRGPQTARELRDRTERMHEFGDTTEVEEVLRDLADAGHVVCLGRQPGQRDERWMHLLGGPVA